MTELELMGDMSKGKCQDCGWNNNSAVAKVCGCMHLINPGDYDQEEHNRLILAARYITQRKDRAMRLRKKDGHY